MDDLKKTTDQQLNEADVVEDAEMNQLLEQEIGARERGEEVEEARRHHHHHHHHHHHSDAEESGGKSDRSAKKRRRRRKRREPLSAGKILLIILIVIILFLLSLIGAFFYLRAKGARDLNESVVMTPIEEPKPEIEDWEVHDDGTITYKGEKYRYNSDLINILVMGIDHEISEISINSLGMADTDIIVSIDKTTGTTRLINISRDAMTNVRMYDENGNYTGVDRMQLCLSYGYGDGGMESCLNTAQAVSYLMYDLPINGYAALDYSQIAVLNDAVGGVEVTILEDMFDFGKVGETVRLEGQQAQTYVRRRNIEALDSNNNRMARQKQWLLSFLGAARQKIKENVTFPITLYRLLANNMVTSIDISEVTYLGSLFASHGFNEGDFRSVAGEVVEGEDGYAEFHIDEEALLDLVVEMFYKKV